MWKLVEDARLRLRQKVQFILWRTLMPIPSFTAINPIVVEMTMTKTKVSDRQTIGPTD